MPETRKPKSLEVVDETEIVPVPDGDRLPDDPKPKAAKPPRKARRRPPRLQLSPHQGCWGTCAFFAGMSVLVMTLVVACMALVMTVELARFMRDPLDNFLAVFGFDPDAEPVTVDSTTIVLGIREMSVLQTATGDILISKTVVDTGAAPDAEITVNFIGRVTAGIDLALVTENSIRTNDDGSLTVILPPAQLTGCYLGKPDIQYRYCADIPLIQDCGKIVERLQEEAYDRGIVELRETAYEMNLLETAYEEAESRIYDLLRNLGYAQVAFERSDDVLPPSPTCFGE